MPGSGEMFLVLSSVESRRKHLEELQFMVSCVTVTLWLTGRGRFEKPPVSLFILGFYLSSLATLLCTSQWNVTVPPREHHAHGSVANDPCQWSYVLCVLISVTEFIQYPRGAITAWHVQEPSSFLVPSSKIFQTN